MHTFIEPVTGIVVLTEMTEHGWRIRNDNTKDNFRVVFRRKRGVVKVISGILSKRDAQTLADTLNALSPRQLTLVVTSLHTAGGEAQRQRQNACEPYVGKLSAKR
jgi:hypothetical protein